MKGAILACAVLAVPACAFAGNVNVQQSLADTKAIIAGGGQADVVVLGDSLSFRDGSYLPYFRDLMQGKYGNAGSGYQGFSETGAWFSGAFDYGQVNADNAPHSAVDGFWQTVNTTTTDAYGKVIPRDQTSTLLYVAKPGGGEVDAYRNVNGYQHIETLNGNAATPTVRSMTYTAPDADHTISLHAVGGPVQFLGLNNTNSNTGMRIHRAANGGWTTQNFLQRDFTFDSTLNALSTDLVMIMLGQNDSGQGMTATQFASNMNTLIDRVQAAAPGADVLLVGSYDSGNPLLGDYADAEAMIAQTRGVGFIDLYHTAGNYAFWQSNGYLDDGVHFSPAGGQYLGNFLYNAVVPEPGTLALLSIGALGLLPRRK